MKTIVCAIQKGGQGKSMLCTHLAHFASSAGLDVLAVDVDGQGTLSKNLLPDFDKNDAPSLYLFSHDSPKIRPIKAHESTQDQKGQIHLFTGDKRLKVVDESPNIKSGTLRKALQRFSNEIDLAIIDPPPTLGKRLEAALAAADYVIMPFVPARESVDGLGDLMDTIQDTQESVNPGLKIIGLLPNKVNSRSSFDKKILDDLHRVAPEMLLPIVIRERTSVSGAMAHSKPVWKFKSGESQKLAAQELLLACGYIINTMFEGQGA